MKRQQIITAIGVFVVGFGLGYGATWILVSDGEQEKTTPSASVVAGPDAQKEKDTASDASALTEQSPDTEEKVPVVADTSVASAGPDTEVDKDEPPEKEAPWWKACLGKNSKVDFGGVRGGLSIRRGSIKHGSVAIGISGLRMRDASKFYRPIEVRQLSCAP